MERKGYESIGWYTFFVTLSYDLDLGFSRSKFENAVSQEWEGQLTWNQKGCQLTECWTHVVTLNFDLTHDLDLEFSMSNFKMAVSQEWEGRLTWNEKDMNR